MSAWKDDDEVTTTYGSIQLSIEQAHAAGVKTERERIIKLLEQHLIPIAASGNDPESLGWREGMRNAIALIKGENE